jgi:hypothetical protein
MTHQPLETTEIKILLKIQLKENYYSYIVCDS